MQHIKTYLIVAGLVCKALSLNAQTIWLRQAEAAKGFKQATYGYEVVEVKSGKVVMEHQAHTALVPASTLKVVTTASALGLLGKNYRYQTVLQAKGKWDIKTGVLEGDLVIKGSGDPSLQSQYFYNDSASVTAAWAKALQAKGVKTITGRVLADASAFQRSMNANWIWGDIGNYFGAPPCGLSYRDNKFSIWYSSGVAGSNAKVERISPDYVTCPLQISSTVVAKGSEDEAYVYGDPFGFSKQVSGTLPPNKTNYEVEAALPDPALLCAEEFAGALQKAGIATDPKKVVSVYEKDSGLVLTDLYVHQSPVLERMVYHTNVRSNNHYAETFLTTMGKGRLWQGISAVKHYWEQRGLDVSELNMVDGSGLSRANTVTTHFLCQLMAKMARDSMNYSAFYNSLPVAGKNGSMSNIGKGTFIENNMRAKTGYINRVRSYCGYVKTKSGKELAFSIIVNNYTCSAKEAKLLLENFMVTLADL